MKKTISFLCAIVTAGAVIVSPCMAADDFKVSVSSLTGNVTPYYLSIYNSDAVVWRSGNSIVGYAQVSYNTIYDATISVIVQRSTDRINWLKAGSFGTENGYNGDIYIEGSYPTVSGYYYRLEATVTVYNGGSVVESLTFHSNIV